jgi:copper homeostasis protein CutC
MKHDILMAKQLGADGVVMGILDVEGNVEVLYKSVSISDV